MLSIFENPIVRQYLIVFSVNLNLLATGLHIGWTSPVLFYLSDEAQSVLPEPISINDGAWLASIGTLGSVFSNLFLIAPLVDLLGRKYSMLVLSIPKLGGCFLYLFANQVWMLLAGRVVITIGDAAMFSIIPVYASEIASTKIRGSIGTILHFMCSLGVVIMFSVGPFLSYNNINIMMTTIIAAAIVPLFFLPDSPYFLYAKGKKEESREVLLYLRDSEEQVNEEIQEYEIAGQQGQENKLDVIKSKTFRKSIVLALLLSIGNMLVGYNAVQFYLQTILASTGMSLRDEFGSMIVGMIQLAGSIFTAFISDRFGRKSILMVTSTGMGLGLFGLGLSFFLTEGGSTSNFLNILPLISLIVYVFSNSSGVGALVWVVLAELFDDKSRGLGMSASLLTANLIGFLTVRFFPPITNAIGPAITYWIFSANSLLLFLFILFFIPETKGKTFSEIQDLLSNKKNVSKKSKGEKEDC